MATIPLEIIVQDAEAPVVPSEDGTNNTETNITVPDTGTINSSGDTSSSASSIILPAILLVLAIGIIVAILIHKYHKQKKGNISKKEKLAVAASSTIAILAILAVTVLIGNLVIPATKAATSDVADGIVPSEDKVSIVVTRDGGSAEVSVESTATITSTSDFGYKVLLSMAEGVETTNLYLDGNENSEYYISAVEDIELANNTWGYALAEDGEYSAVPLLNEAATVAQGDEPVEAENLSIYYGVKVSSDLPAGTYSGGEIEYTLTDNGFPAALTTMQGMTHEICESVYTPSAFKVDGVTIEDNVPTATLTDIRDNKTYTIAKLADGKCWMTQNLDLQKENLLAGVALDNTNTDNPAGGFELPDSQTSGNSEWYYRENNKTIVDTLHVYDLGGDGTKYYNCANYSPGPGCVEYSDDEIPSKDLGNYYNWYTATAGTGTDELANGAVALGSICPVGWKLPNGGNGENATDYSILLNKYGIYSSVTSSGEYIGTSRLVKEPFRLMYTGMYNSRVNRVGTGGNLWTSTAREYSSNAAVGAVGANSFAFNMDSVDLFGNYVRYFGNSVRCVAE